MKVVLFTPSRDPCYQKRAMRPRKLLLLCAVVAALAAGYALLAPTGLPKLQHKEREVAKLQADVAALERENERLTEEGARLQEGALGAAVYLEDAAREELGWVKPGEHVLLLANGPANEGSHRPRGEAP